MAFGRGKIDFLESENTKVLAFVRSYNGEKILVVVNLSRYAQAAYVEMQSLKDLIPVEVFSQNKFHKIGEEPYAFTLSPYGYYWFKLAEEKENISIIPVNENQILNIRKWSDLVSVNLKDKVTNEILVEHHRCDTGHDRLAALGDALRDRPREPDLGVHDVFLLEVARHRHGQPTCRPEDGSERR